MIKLYKFPACVDWRSIRDTIKHKHGIDIEDVAGKFSDEAVKSREDSFNNWLKENNYDQFKQVLDFKDPQTKEDWPKESEEMAKRIEIMSKWSKIELQRENKTPYQNFWHLICDDFNRGAPNYLYLEYQHDDPDWVVKIKKLIKEEVKNSPAYDLETNCLIYTCDW